MKRVIFYLFAAIVVLSVACNNEKPWYDDRNYGIFTFNESETIVEVTPDMRSIRLEGHYLKRPDNSLDGVILLAVDNAETTAQRNVHYLYFDADYSWVILNKSASGDNYYYDVTIQPENIDREVCIVFFNTIVSNDLTEGSKYPERISSAKIILKPAE